MDWKSCRGNSTGDSKENVIEKGLRYHVSCMGTQRTPALTSAVFVQKITCSFSRLHHNKLRRASVLNANEQRIERTRDSFRTCGGACNVK